MPANSDAVPVRPDRASDEAGEWGDVAVNAAAGWVASRLPGRPVLDATDPPRFASAWRGSGNLLSVLTRHRAVADALRAELPIPVSVHHGELASLPFPDNSFGIVVFGSSELSSVPAEKVLSEVARVVEVDGAILILLEDYSSDSRTDASQLAEWCSSHFAHCQIVARSDFLVSVMGESDPAAPLVVESDFSPSGRAAFLVATDTASILVNTPVVTVEGIDVMGAWHQWRESFRRVRGAGARAAQAELAVLDRADLLRQLHLSEQELALAFDAQGQHEARLESANTRIALLDEKCRQLVGVEAQLISANAELVGLREGQARSRIEIARLAEQVTALQAAHAESVNAVLEIRQSTSWRVTRPIRLLKRLLNG